MNLEQQNSMRNMMKSDYGDNKLDKSKELNETMSITKKSGDQYTKKIHNIGGNE